MRISITPRMRFATLAVSIVALAGILSGCGEADERSAPGPTTSPPAATTSTSTTDTGRLIMVIDDAPTAEDVDELRVRSPYGNPFDTIASFVEALEAEDENAALEFVASSRRATYKKLFQDIDLKALAADLRDFPIIPLTVGERYAEFLRVGTATGEVRHYPMTMSVEGNKWKIVGL